MESSALESDRVPRRRGDWPRRPVERRSGRPGWAAALVSAWLAASCGEAGGVRERDEDRSDDRAASDEADDSGSVTDDGPGEGIGVDAECDLAIQDCAVGLKCMPRLAGPWFKGVCVQIQGPGSDGDACVHDGLVLATDDCDAAHFCLGPVEFDGTGWLGRCRPLCGPQAQCGDDRVCDTSEAVALCLDRCHPLDPNVCAPGDRCALRLPSIGFACIPKAPAPSALGEACASTLACDEGLYCGKGAPGCDDGACCAELCDARTDPSCSLAWLGASCVPLGLTQPGLGTIGLCTIPS